jgi:hypothetical protein
MRKAATATEEDDMLAGLSAAAWTIIVVAALIVLVGLYVFGTKREERSHSEESENPLGRSEPNPPRQAVVHRFEKARRSPIAHPHVGESRTHHLHAAAAGTGKENTMRCPVCWSPNTLTVPSRTSNGQCEACGSTWLCRGGQAIRIKRPIGMNSQLVQSSRYEAIR